MRGGDSDKRMKRDSRQPASGGDETMADQGAQKLRAHLTGSAPFRALMTRRGGWSENWKTKPLPFTSAN